MILSWDHSGRFQWNWVLEIYFLLFIYFWFKTKKHRTVPTAFWDIFYLLLPTLDTLHRLRVNRKVLWHITWLPMIGIIIIIIIIVWIYCKYFCLFFIFSSFQMSKDKGNRFLYANMMEQDFLIILIEDGGVTTKCCRSRTS